MAEVSGTWTLERWERLPRDGNRYELLDGELLVTPSPAMIHQRLVTRLVVALHPYVSAGNLGEVWAGPIDVFAGPRTVLEPDVAVTLGPESRRVRSWRDLKGPDLAVEIISPSSAQFDRGRKREVYLGRGSEYWIVDPDARLIERWLPGDERPTVHRQTLDWHAVGAPEPLRLDVLSLFADLDTHDA